MRITLNLITHAAPENVVAFRGDGVSGHALAAVGSEQIGILIGTGQDGTVCTGTLHGPPLLYFGGIDTAAYH